MPWPMSQDYNEAIQTPTACFNDAELKAGQPVCNAMGLPQPCSGNFADVYALQTPRRKWAIKCFTREIPGIRERYVEISKYLAQQQLPFMVEFKFLDQGIRLRGQWYPVLKMHWVEGFTLNHFVKQQLDKPQVLRTLAGMWVKMAARLREARLAHGDLQHGNVLMVPGAKANMLALRLVDYDGMCVPSPELPRSIEVGHPNFQHPQRLQDGTCNLEIDRFAHLVIGTALQALALAGRKLWHQFDNGDNLLFKQSDFMAPGSSPLFAELNRLGDAQVCQLAAALALAATRPLNEVPLLETVLDVKTVVPVQEPLPVAGSSPPAMPVQTKSRASPSRLWAVLAGSLAIVILGVVYIVWPSAQATRQQAGAEITQKTQSIPMPLNDPPPSDTAPTKPSGANVEPRLVPDAKAEPAPAPATIEPRVLLGHQQLVNGVAFSPDGRQLLSCSADRTLRLWDVTQCRELFQLLGQQDPSCAVFSPDGQCVLAAEAKRIRLWDLKTQLPVRDFATEVPATGLVFAADGKRFLSAGNRSTSLWDVATGQKLLTFENVPARGITLSPDQKGVLLTESLAHDFGLYDIGPGPALRSFEGHSQPVQQALFTPDGKWIVSCSNDGTVCRWDPLTGLAVHRFKAHDRGVRAMALSPDGKQLVTGGYDGAVCVWDVATGQLLHQLVGHKLPVLTVAFSPDGAQVASAGVDQAIHLWPVQRPAVAAVHMVKPEPTPILTVTEQALAQIRKLGGKLRTADTLPGNPVIAVDLNSKPVHDADLAHLRVWPQLRELAISHTIIGDAGLAHLESLTELRHLDADDTSITDAGLAHLRGLRNLESLRVASGDIGDAGLAHLKALTELRTLKLHRTGISDEGLAHLTGLGHLQELDLGHTQISDLGLRHLKGLDRIRRLYLVRAHRVSNLGLTSLKGLVRLNELLLTGTSIDDAGLAQLKVFPDLHRLWLDELKITDLGLRQLAACQELQELNLAQTRITAAGLTHLRGLPRLTSLNLSDLPVTDSGLARLINLGQLQELNLWNTRVTNAGLVYARAWPGLRKLYLGNTAVTDAGLAHLVKLDQLQHLTLRGTKVTDQGVAALKKSLPTLFVNRSDTYP